MFHVTSSLFGGFAAIAAWALVSPTLDPGAKTGLSAYHQQLNRAAKADRLAPPLSYRHHDSTVATVEVIGVHDAAIVYRDRTGRLLFQTDPVSNVTVITKGFVLPQVTVRDTPHSTPEPIEAPHTRDATPAMPVGCEPVASPIAEPALAHLTGRCLSSLDLPATRVAEHG
jgi:hypothetical protein